MPLSKDSAVSDYVLEPGAWDEAIDGNGTIRPAHRAPLSALTRTGLQAAAERVARDVDGRGIHFGDDDSPFVVDPVPRAIDAAEWRRLEQGLAQRAQALDAFVADVHGPRRIVADDVIPAAIVDQSPFAEPDIVGLDDPPPISVAIAGLDVARDAEGDFRVIEDNTRTPSGLAYMLASRAAIDRVLGVPEDVEPLHDVVGGALRTALWATLPDGTDRDGVAVLLSNGPENTAWWEHEQLAGLMEVPLVTPADLRLRNDGLELRDGGRPVAAVYRRTDDASLRTDAGTLTDVGALLLPAMRAGTVGIMNGYGAGVADDKAVYPYVSDLIRYFCGVEPLLADLRVYDLGNADERTVALDRAEDLVFKPRDGQGGQGVVIGPRASAGELRRTLEAARADPAGWIAQEAIVLSTHPTVIDGVLEPRHVDLRPFVLADGAGGRRLLPGALTRVALGAGQMVVNSSRGGGSKDTWVAR